MVGLTLDWQMMELMVGQACQMSITQLSPYLIVTIANGFYMLLAN
jgi:hypothetical protein